MNTYTVPVFLGVKANSKEEAVALALNFMEYAVDIGNDANTYPYCDVGSECEVAEQIES